jgi:8-oxo-dGTP pyrophosphatase MutT (NUDIX family)
MVERTPLVRKNSVIFVLFDGRSIQLEERVEKNDRYLGYFLVPGGKVEPGEGPNSALIREIREEYALIHIKGEELGLIIVPEGDVESCKHVYLITGWEEGNLYDAEQRNLHLSVSLEEARRICKHPVTQTVLDLCEAHLPRQDS